MELDDIPVPPAPPSSSAGVSSTSEDGGDLAWTDAWRKAQHALQKTQVGEKGPTQDPTTNFGANVYNQYGQPYAWPYPGYGMTPSTRGNYPPWMQSAYSGWGQQSATSGNFQRFGFNSAPTQVGSALSTPSTPSSGNKSSSESSVPVPSSFQSNQAIQQHVFRGPIKRGFGVRPGGGGGVIRFQLGRQRGGSCATPNRFASDRESSSFGSTSFGDASVSSDADCAGEENPNKADEGNAARRQEMPETMKKYIERAYSAAETAEQKNQVELALKQRITPLLRSGEAWNMDWEQEPLPTDSSFALRLLKANNQSRLRGVSHLGPRGARGGLLSPPRGPPPMLMGMRNAANIEEQQWGNREMIMNRGRGGRGLRRAAQRPSFGGQQPFFSRSRSRSKTPSSRGSNGEDASLHRLRKRRESGSQSPGAQRKHHRRGSSDSGHSSASSRRSDNASNSSSDKESWKKKEKRRQKGIKRKGRGKKNLRKRYDKEDVDNDDHEFDQNHMVAVSSSVVPKVGKKQKKKKKGIQFTMDTTPEQEAMKQQRAMRFADHIKPKTGPQTKSLASRLGKRIRGVLGIGGDSFLDDRSNSNQSPDSPFEFDPSAFQIVGTCQTLEKQYLRLTTAPDPSQVRPQPVLFEALALVKRKWKEKGDYRYICDQLKSIRQDMTIQCIRNRFTVEVYETHARLALEKADREEFNQCQSQLKALYAELPGCPNEFEFTAYRLLFYVYMENTMDITTILAHMTPEMFRDECIEYALKIKRAWSLCDYNRLFKLAAPGRPPRMCAYVLELFMERERKRALKTMLKAYRPVLPVDYIAEKMAFESKEDCIKFLRQLQVTFVDDTSKVDCRQPVAGL